MPMTNAYRAVALLLLVPVALSAQVADDEAGLRNWQAPLYWQPTGAEHRAIEELSDVVANSNGVTGTAGPPSPLILVGITPCRVVDTRDGQGFTGAFGPPSLDGAASRTFPLRASTTCAIPSIAQAYSLKVTMVRRGPLGYIRIYPTGQVLPRTAARNAKPGFIVNSAAIARAGADGSVDAYASDPTDLIIDINGYYAPVGAMLARFDAASTTSSPTEPSAAVAIGAGGASSSSPGAIEPIDIIHNKSMTFNGLTNSITVDSVAPPSPGKPNELYLGGDNTGGPGGPIPFSKFKLGIGTKAISGGKVTIFDPLNPSLDIVTNVITGGGARIELGVASAPGNFSNIATGGDAIVRANAGQTQDLILAASNGNQGAIRFATGFAAGCGGLGAESQKMVLTNAGSLGIGPQFGTGNPFCIGGPEIVSQRLDVDGGARIRSLPLNNSLTDVVVADVAGVLFKRAANTLGSAAGDPADDWVRTAGNMFPFVLTDNVGIGTASPTSKLFVLQNSPASSDQFAVRVQNSSTVSNGHRVGLEVQNVGSLGGFKDDVGIWVRTVNGNTPANGHANMAAVLDGNVAIGTLSIVNQEIGTQGKYVLSMKNGSAPITSPSAYQGIQLWSQLGELRVKDASGNTTTLSPHNFSMMAPSEPMAWSYYSENQTLNKKISVDMLRLTRAVERMSGERLALIHELDADATDNSNVEVPGTGEILELGTELLRAKARITALETQIADLRAMMIKTMPQ